MSLHESHLIQREHSKSVGSMMSLSSDLSESVAPASSGWKMIRNKMRHKHFRQTCAHLCGYPESSPDLALLWSSLLSGPSSSTSPIALLHFRLRMKQWSSLLLLPSPCPLKSHRSDHSGAALRLRLNSDDNQLELKVWDRGKEHEEEMSQLLWFQTAEGGEDEKQLPTLE